MVTTCLQCGNSGFSEALNYCHECRVYAVHCYCLDVLPATFDEYVVWLCENCELKVVKPSTLEETYPLPVGERERKNVLVSKSLGEAAETCEPLELINCEDRKKVEEKRGRRNSLDECSLHEEGDSYKTEHSQLTKCDAEPLEVIYDGVGEKCAKIGRKNISDECSVREEAESLNLKNCLLAICDLQPLVVNPSKDGENNEKLRQINRPDGEILQEESESVKTRSFQMVSCDVRPLKMIRCKDREEDQNIRRCYRLNDGGFDEETESNQTTNNELVLYDDPYITEQGCNVRAQPIKEPIWWGSLSIFNKRFGSFGGLIAHLSSLAFSKVSEEAILLPALLSTDLLPRSDLWP